MKSLVLASRNKDKIEELRATLSPLDIELKSALDFPALEEVIEDRDTLKGNALKKARYVHQQTGLPALADDTGLEVDALDGRPGVYSARYAGEDASYQQNIEKLLKALEEVAPKDRSAQFRTVVAYVKGKEAHTFEGVCRGVILQERKGRGGFGYDPLFQPDGFQQSFAELRLTVKNEISHRGKAIHKFYDWLSENEL